MSSGCTLLFHLVLQTHSKRKCMLHCPAGVYACVWTLAVSNRIHKALSLKRNPWRISRAPFWEGAIEKDEWYIQSTPEADSCFPESPACSGWLEVSALTGSQRLDDYLQEAGVLPAEAFSSPWKPLHLLKVSKCSTWQESHQCDWAEVSWNSWPCTLCVSALASVTTDLLWLSSLLSLEVPLWTAKKKKITL